MEKITSKDGTVISYLKEGTGPPLILVHGTTADHTRWLPIIPFFEKNFTVYAVDRRGRSGSGDHPEYSLNKEAEDIASIIESIDEDVYLFGHSFGGLVALETAFLTDKIKKMIIYEAPVPTGIPIYPPGSLEKMQVLFDKNNKEAALEFFLKEVVKMPDYEFEKYSKLPAYKKRVEISPTILREAHAELSYEFYTEKFNKIKIPVLLLTGSDSPEFMKKATEVLDDVLPESRITVMQGEQHIAMDTNRELFIDIVSKFLTE